MEVHSTESKSSAPGAVTAAADEAAHKQKENGNGNVAAAVTTANSSIDDSKVKMATTQTFTTAAPMVSSAEFTSRERLLLLEDSTLDDMPEYCKNIFACIDTQKMQQVDLLMILTYCIALESNFTLTDSLAEVQLDPVYWGSSFHKTNTEKLAKIPNDLKGNNENYVFNLTFYPLPNITGIVLIGIQSGEFLILTITPGSEEPGRSICLPISRYVLSSIRSQSISARFRNLKELSYELKEKLFTPARIHLSELSGCEVYLGLCGMPEEIIYLILRSMKLNIVQNLSKTCRKMRCICENYRNHRPTKRCDVISSIATPSSASSLQLSFLTNILD